MKTRTLAEIRAQRGMTPEREAAIQAGKDELLAEMALHELREERGVSQTELAEKLGVSRPRVHTIEKGGEDLRLSTVSRYVQALGGTVKVVAVFEDDDEHTILG